MPKYLPKCLFVHVHLYDRAFVLTCYFSCKNWREMTILWRFAAQFCPKIFASVINVVIWGDVPRHDMLIGSIIC